MRILRSVSALLLLHSATSSASTWLQTNEELTREYCATSAHGTCYVPNRPAAVLPFPPKLGHVIEKHIAEASSRKYYDELSLRDFFHGHFIIRGPRFEFENEEQFFDSVSLILYHTAEYNNRWEHEADRNIAVQARTPRSLLGFLDGFLIPASEVVLTHGNGFDNSGTIYSNEVASAMPQFTSLDYQSYGVPDIFVQVGGGDPAHRCQVDSLQFYIVQSRDGIFRAPGGEPISIFIRCVQSTGPGPISYVALSHGS